MKTRPARNASRTLVVTAVLLAAGFTPLPATASTSASANPSREVAAVARSLGDRTAGFYYDAAARTTVVTVTDPADAAAVRRADATPKRVERSQADLDRITDALHRNARISGTAWGVDVPTNQVVVSYDDTVTTSGLARLRSVAARFGDAIRLSRTTGVIRPYLSGGEYVYGDVGIRCLLSFNVRNSAGAQFFLTAGPAPTRRLSGTPMRVTLSRLDPPPAAASPAMTTASCVTPTRASPNRGTCACTTARTRTSRAQPMRTSARA